MVCVRLVIWISGMFFVVPQAIFFVVVLSCVEWFFGIIIVWMFVVFVLCRYVLRLCGLVMLLRISRNGWLSEVIRFGRLFFWYWCFGFMWVIMFWCMVLLFFLLRYWWFVNWIIMFWDLRVWISGNRCLFLWFFKIKIFWKCLGVCFSRVCIVWML